MWDLDKQHRGGGADIECGSKQGSRENYEKNSWVCGWRSNQLEEKLRKRMVQGVGWGRVLDRLRDLWEENVWINTSLEGYSSNNMVTGPTWGKWATTRKVKSWDVI